MKFSWGQDALDERTSRFKDYSGYSEQELLNQFKSSEWDKANEGERIALIQELEYRSARTQGREPAEIVSLHDVGCFGQYSSMKNRISIDVTDFSSYEALDTYIHESNHAYQDYCVKHGISNWNDGRILRMIQVETARDKHGNLYNYEKDSPMYDMQCNELDSNNKAVSFMLSQKERYQEDPQYAAYIKERAEHFQEVNGFLEHNRQQRLSVQEIQMKESFRRGDISGEQSVDLSRLTKDGNYLDETVMESQSLGVILDSLNHELNMEYDADIGRDFNYMEGLPDMGNKMDEGFDYKGGTECADIQIGTVAQDHGNDYSAGM